MSINLCPNCMKQYSQVQLDKMIAMKQNLTCIHFYIKTKNKKLIIKK